ncbi:hypothetical protein, partial [Klebsiella sp. Kps]|uniref:hypothetical protein n=1 Tax=Klebsiella sp. Kps TaxID=2758579 RepID=UPI001C9A191F
SPWHARRLAHVDPDTLTGDDLSIIPVMTKADVMANWDDVVTDRRLTLELAEAHLVQVASGGPPRGPRHPGAQAAAHQRHQPRPAAHS